MYLQFWYLPNGRLNFYYWDAKQSDSRWVALDCALRPKKQQQQQQRKNVKLEKINGVRRGSRFFFVFCAFEMPQNRGHTNNNLNRNKWTCAHRTIGQTRIFGEQNHRKFIGFFFFISPLAGFCFTRTLNRPSSLDSILNFKRYKMTRRLFFSLLSAFIGQKHIQSRSHSCVTHSERLPAVLAGAAVSECRWIVWRKTPRNSLRFRFLNHLMKKIPFFQSRSP